MKYIYKNRNRWTVKKSFNGVTRQFKSFDSLDDAIEYRDYLISHDWEEPEEERLRKAQIKYYNRVNRDSSGRWFRVKHKSGRYISKTKDIFDALYYRDLYSDSDLTNIPLLEDCDLSDNPYRRDGLSYPIPERLILDTSTPKRGKGKILKKSVSCYSIYFGRKYICNCRTYEHAYFVRRELVKCDWDISELDRIFEEYPVFYTELLHFYIYLSFNNGKWLLTIPSDKSDDGKMQHIYYSKLEDALFERDFLVEHDWDYDLLVECIDDRLNPYYNMELPPYPERKIRNISPRKSHDDDFLFLRSMIRDDSFCTVDELSEVLGITSATLRLWFKQYGTDSTEFREVCIRGDNPLDFFKQEDLVYAPDLSRSLPNFKGYIHYKPDRRSKYCVSRRDVYYGAYSSRSIAERVVKELVKVDWDKSKLPLIKEKLNITRPVTNRLMYIYRSRRNSGIWRIRKKVNGRTVTFGSFSNLEVAVIARDILVSTGFEWGDLDGLKLFSEWIFYCRSCFYGGMFGGLQK